MIRLFTLLAEKSHCLQFFLLYCWPIYLRVCSIPATFSLSFNASSSKYSFFLRPSCTILQTPNKWYKAYNNRAKWNLAAKLKIGNFPRLFALWTRWTHESMNFICFTTTFKTGLNIHAFHIFEKNYSWKINPNWIF